jgi:hypothetical protein
MNHEHHQASANKKGLYTCPMHPEIQRDEPGKCPICGMDLVQQEPESGNDEELSDKHSSQQEGQITYTCPMHPEVVTKSAGQLP